MRKSLNILAVTLMFSTCAPAAELKVNSTDGIKAAINKPQPVYSPIARQMKVAGRVEVEATVDPNGAVASVKAVTGNPMLTQSAITAVEKWKFTPFTVDGKAVTAIVSLNFDFKP